MITNDDGIESPGLWALAAAARDAGFEVTVAAPHIDASGVGTSVLAVRDGDGHVRIHRRDRDGITGYAVEGPPAFIVRAATLGWLESPDVVLSGINIGANTGDSVLHSGTVGAALTAGLCGRRALAVSLTRGWEAPEPPHWEAATSVLPDVLDMLLAAPDATVLSLNVPDLPVTELGPVREATLAHYGRVRVTITEADERLRADYLGPGTDPDPDSDVALLAAGHPTLTELSAVTAKPRLFTASS